MTQRPARRVTKAQRPCAVTVLTVLHPVGRLPSQVYWRRRMLLIAIMAVVAIVAGWFLIGGASGEPEGPTPVAESTTAEPSPAEGPTATSDDLTDLEEVVPTAPVDPSAPEGTTAPTPTATPPPAPTTPPPPAEPGPCPDAAIGITVGSELGTYPGGSRVRMDMSVTNVGAVPCLRDLDIAGQTWGLFAADGTRLWGSNDCYPAESAPNVVLLAPGQAAPFSIIWSGQGSEETCTAPRQVLGPGSYVLRGYLNTILSPDAVLVLT